MKINKELAKQFAQEQKVQVEQVENIEMELLKDSLIEAICKSVDFSTLIPPIGFKDSEKDNKEKLTLYYQTLRKLMSEFYQSKSSSEIIKILELDKVI